MTSLDLNNDGLFQKLAGYDDDPIQPVKDKPTPVDIVATLTPHDRATRVGNLTRQALTIYKEAADAATTRTVARCVLLSGGRDSTTVAHLFRHEATHILHVNTGTGIPATTQFVRDLAAEWNLPLIEVEPDDTYEALVLGEVKTKRTGEDVWPGGFPGPGAHGTMFQRLKERALDKARHELGIANSRTVGALWIAGRRREESERRRHIPSVETDGTVTWVSPVLNWTSLDLTTYRKLHKVPVNPVTDHLHMSGECLCGAFAKPGELDEIRMFYPDVAERITNLEQRVAAAGFPTAVCRWGHGGASAARSSATAKARLCSSCEALWTES